MMTRCGHGKARAAGSGGARPVASGGQAIRAAGCPSDTQVELLVRMSMHGAWAWGDQTACNVDTGSLGIMQWTS